MLYSCAQFSKVDVYSPNLDDVCPKIGSKMKIELKKDFNKKLEKARKQVSNLNFIKFN